MGTIEKVTTPKTGKTRYLARYSYTDSSGKRAHRKHRFDRKKDAEAWLAQNEADLSRGVYFEPSRELFGVFVDRWAAELRMPVVRASTIYDYRSVVKLRFGSIRSTPLCDLTPAQLGRLIDDWRVAGLAEGTIAQAKMVLNIVLRHAVDSRKLLRNPLSDVKKPVGASERDEVWSPDEVRSFLRATKNDEAHYLYVLLFYTLARIGEIAALTWDDVDLDAGWMRISITWTKDEQGRQVVGDQPKTARSKRMVPLLPEVVDVLRAVRATRPDDDVWVAQLGGRKASPGRIRVEWHKAKDRLKMTPLRPHGARRSGATAMIANGVSVGIVQKLLGHKDPKFTMRIYVKLRDEDSAPGLASLGRIYDAVEAGIPAPRVQIASNSGE